MKKIYLGLIAVSACFASFAQENHQDIAPYIKSDNNIPSKASFDIHFSFAPATPTSASGVVGCAASNFMFGHYYAAKWQNDTIFRYDPTGTFVNALTIPNLTGIRAFTTDGTWIYASNNTGTIYRIDPATHTLSPPHITSASTFSVRGATYSAALNSGAGGFWVSAFASDFVAISMSGSVLSTIPAATHGLAGVYGIAVDDFTVGGPYIWAFDQGAPNTANIVGIRVSDGSTARAAFDIFPDMSSLHATTSTLAGGIFVSNTIVAGQTHIGGLAQGAPANVLFVYELNNPWLGLEEATAAPFTLYPNPTENTVNVTVENHAAYTIFDLTGKKVLTGSLTNGVNTLNVSNLNQGSYLFNVEQNGTISTKKLILN